MRGVNKAIILGRAGKDTEVRSTKGGKSVASMSIATDSSWVKDGEKHEKTEWHKVVAWGKLAEIAGDYVHKGKQVYIEGRIQTQSWVDEQGNKRYSTEIVADQIVLLGGKDESKKQDVAEAIFTGAEVPGEFDPPKGGDF